MANGSFSRNAHRRKIFCGIELLTDHLWLLENCLINWSTNVFWSRTGAEPLVWLGSEYTNFIVEWTPEKVDLTRLLLVYWHNAQLWCRLSVLGFRMLTLQVGISCMPGWWFWVPLCLCAEELLQESRVPEFEGDLNEITLPIREWKFPQSESW